MSANETSQKLAELLFPGGKTTDDYRAAYPPRRLPDGAAVTRIAPSPTGYMHIGGIYAALISRKLAKQTAGIFYLRIEDTDKKREIEGAKKIIIEALREYALFPDEGPISDAEEVGAYGPYIQSMRQDIYRAFTKELIAKGRAYPCFATEEDLEAMRKSQERAAVKPGYYGTYAPWRGRPLADVETKLAQNVPFVIRLRSEGDETRTFAYEDLMKGKLTIPENHQDFVLLKSDGLPTYHLAHAVDDFLMGTTHVIRGDEWLSSVPVHFELFKAFGFPVPRFGHIAPIQKMDADGGKRKLSKRKDPEATVLYYKEKGYPAEAVIEYLLNLANSNFEDWRKANPDASLETFELSLKKMGGAGPLFDEVKLRDIAKNIVAHMKAEEVYEKTLSWAKDYDKAFALLLATYKEYVVSFLAIERGDAKARKDIASWSDISFEFSYFFDELFTTPVLGSLQSPLSEDEKRAVTKAFLELYDTSDDRDAWFEKVKKLAAEYNFAPNIKEFKKNPAAFRGQVGELAQVIRYALSGRTKTPDLYAMMRVMGQNRVTERLKRFISS